MLHSATQIYLVVQLYYSIRHICVSVYRNMITCPRSALVCAFLQVSSFILAYSHVHTILLAMMEYYAFSTIRDTHQ